jgi:hypothetical protein
MPRTAITTLRDQAKKRRFRIWMHAFEIIDYCRTWTAGLHGLRSEHDDRYRAGPACIETPSIGRQPGGPSSKPLLVCQIHIVL